jgi:hypothetical protein
MDILRIKIYAAYPLNGRMHKRPFAGSLKKMLDMKLGHKRTSRNGEQNIRHLAVKSQTESTTHWYYYHAQYYPPANNLSMHMAYV